MDPDLEAPWETSGRESASAGARRVGLVPRIGLALGGIVLAGAFLAYLGLFPSDRLLGSIFVVAAGLVVLGMATVFLLVLWEMAKGVGRP